MRTGDPLAQIIGDIYEGVLEPARWESAMRGFRDLSGSHAIFLAITDKSSHSLVASSVAGPETSRMDDALELYRNELVPFDPG